MATSLETLRDKILTSIHGRRLGIDPDGFLVGPKPVRRQVSNATSGTTGTAIPNNGFHTVSTTTDDTWTLTDPVPGCKVDIGTVSTSTGTHTVSPVAATVVSTNGVAGSGIALNGLGDVISLIGISTSQWMVTNNDGCVVSS